LQSFEAGILGVQDVLKLEAEEIQKKKERIRELEQRKKHLSRREDFMGAAKIKEELDQLQREVKETEEVGLSAWSSIFDRNH
jgi:protein-arginine kinase activator protein McsA